MFRGSGKKFSTDELLKLIRMYRENECLWDIHSEKYKHLSLRAESFKKIASEFGMPVDIVKRKLKSLRSTYIIERKKVDAANSVNAEMRESKLFWFSEMKFLDRIIVFRYQPSRCAQTEVEKSTYVSDNTEYLESINESPTMSVQRLCSYEGDSGNSPGDSVNMKSYYKMKISPPKITLEPQRSPLQRRNEMLQNSNTLHEETLVHTQNSTKFEIPTIEDNVFDLFGKTVALQLNELFRLDKKSAYEVMQQQHLIMSQKMIDTLQQQL